METSVIESDDFIFHINNGNLIEYKFLKSISFQKQQLKILHQAFPSVLFQRKFLVLHGSAFEYNGKGILILGNSASGKSESINLIQRGQKIITDDIISLKVSKNSVISSPGLSALCISNKNSLLPLHDNRLRSLEFISNEAMYKNDIEITDIFFLKWGKTNKITNIEKTDSFKELIVNSFRPIPTGASKKSEEFFLSSTTNLLDNTKQHVFFREKGDIQESISKLYNFLKNKYD